MDSQAVIEAMSAAVARRVPEWYGKGALALPAAGVERRRFSFFLRYPVVGAAGSARVLVKVPRRPETESLAVAATEPASPGAVREYETLVAIRDRVVDAASTGLRAVRPLALLDPWNAFAMEEVQGRSLKRLVSRWAVPRGSPAQWAGVERAYRSAGEWLARFHDRVGGAHEEPLDRARLQRLAAAAACALERAAAGRLDTTWVWNALQGRIQALTSPCERVAELHGDFTPANVLVTPDGQIAVLDTHRAASGSVYEDVARLATDLSTTKLQVLSHGLAYGRRAADRCGLALLDGYFGDRPADRALLSVHCGLAVVRKWAEDEERVARAGLPPGAGRALSAWVGRFLSRQLLDWLER